MRPDPLAEQGYAPSTEGALAIILTLFGAALYALGRVAL